VTGNLELHRLKFINKTFRIWNHSCTRTQSLHASHQFSQTPCQLSIKHGLSRWPNKHSTHIDIAFVNASENCVRYDKSDRSDFISIFASCKLKKKSKTKRCYMINPISSIIINHSCVTPNNLSVHWKKNSEKHLLWCSWRKTDIWPDDLRRRRFDSSRKSDGDPKVRSINVNLIWDCLSDRSSSIIMKMNANELREQWSPPTSPLSLSLSFSLSCSNWVIVTHTVLNLLSLFWFK